MRYGALSFLVCPRCVGPLELTVVTREGDEILSGQLHCHPCRKTYPIVGGVPRFVGHALDESARATVDRFGEQWNEFTFMSAEYEQQFLSWIAPITAEAFRDRVVLDGGCGKGRHSQIVARFGARDVLAVDLSSAVDTAFRNLRHLPNVHVLQADLFHLPVTPHTVDIAFSIGVVHHTPDPRGAFDHLVNVLKPGGRVIVWVYGRENNEWIIRFVDPIRKALTSRLPHRWLYHLTKIPAAILYVAARGIYQPLSRPPWEAIGRRLFYHVYMNALAHLPFRDVHLIVHDHLGPAIASYISGDEFRRWFDRTELTDVTIGWHNQNSWRGTAVRAAP